jgi:hypothetical protein
MIVNAAMMMRDRRMVRGAGISAILDSGDEDEISRWTGV